MSSLPNFIIIGAAKSGTTSLYDYLQQHPEVFMSPVKEPRYFAYARDLGGPDASPPMNGPGDDWANRNSVFTMEAYRRLFDGAGGHEAVGEASPVDLYSEAAPARLRRLLPQARLIALLRDPVERAYSHFMHLVKTEREPLRDFEAALDAEPERRAKGWEWSWHYRALGFYHIQIKRYLRHFDREQLTVYLFENLKQDAVALARDLFGVLGVDPAFTPDVSVQHRKTGVPRFERFQRFLFNPDNPLRRLSRLVLPEAVRERLLVKMKNANVSKPPLPEDARARLAEAYRDDVRRLEDLIDRDLSGWL
jgi:hypothetical protein